MVQYMAPELCPIFHALGDPTRMAMVMEASRGEVALADLAAERRISLTATLKHLKVLEGAGLMHSTKVGRERRCRVKPEAFAGIASWLEETRRAWAFRLDNLETYLEETA
jgi:DNA-binding transcriptional ArsR family regulator